MAESRRMVPEPLQLSEEQESSTIVVASQSAAPGRKPRLVASRDLIWDSEPIGNISNTPVPEELNAVPPVPSAPSQLAAENAIWTNNSYLANDGLTASKPASSFIPEHLDTIITASEQPENSNFDTGPSNTESFSWDDLLSMDSTNLLGDFGPMDMEGFPSINDPAETSRILFNDSAEDRRPGLERRPLLNFKSYGYPSPLPSPPDQQSQEAEDENSEPNTSLLRLISICRPSGPRNKVPPSAIQKYFSQLPMTIQQKLFQMARSQDYKFIDMISSDIATLNSGSDSGAEIYIAQRMPGAISTITRHAPFQYNATQAPTASTNLNPYINNLTISRISYFASMFMNASMFGFDFGHYLDESSTSPLYDPELVMATEQNVKTAVAMRYSGVAKDLRPVMAQVTKKHHPYLDVLPFPMFRQRAITAASTEPPLLDEDELCIDLMIKDGLVCWGSPGGSAGMDMGAPWDMRSWEAKPWFLKKWWWLIGDKDDDMRSGSQWWRMMKRVNG
ncbi:hypothetical protein D0Z07_6928 [Hyphodiscus hymeniophilus]|uniref:Uncharacterized protein n=1 Tax=Hyphodiscus hymeniophilus TaxID=353542 RepID=A0A9P6VGG8_9HELO|nr:hypothetical protein D0Z07_6928 [Hyphodiscus hymeniophilus]